MAWLLRLLITLAVLAGAPLSALGCGMATQGHVELAEAPRGEADTDTARAGRGTVDVGQSNTSTVSGRVRQASRGQRGLLYLLSHALAGADEEPDDEFEAGDDPDLVDDDCHEGYAVFIFCGLSVPPRTALYIVPNPWGIQPSTGHPHGIDEPPRI